MEKRVFIAIPASPKLREEVRAWTDGHPHLPLRWLGDASLHMTILPPWSEGDVGGAMALLEASAGSGQFDIRLETIDWGGAEWMPDLVWITGRDNEEFTRLRTTVERSFGREAHRPFLPHITVGRVPRGASIGSREMIGGRFDWTERVETVALYESLGNSEYRIIGTVAV